MKEDKNSQKKEIGMPGYINKRCWVAKNFSYPLTKYCQYCELKFRECPIFQFSIVSLILIISLFFISFSLEKKISLAIIISVLCPIFLYSFFYNKGARKIVETQFTKKKTQEALEEARSILEIKVRARTRELRELAEKLDEKVKRRTKQLEEEKDKTLAIITNFTDGVLVLGKENEISLINPSAESFFQVKAEEVIGKSILELNSFSDFKPLVRLFGSGMKRVFRKEIPIRENLTIEVSVVPIVSKEEKLGTLFVLRNITREKLIERMKTEFVSLSAHQLRTPLSAIKWSLKILLDGDVGEITEEQKTLIQKTYEANERMIELINDLLDVTRIEEGRYLYKPQPTDIEEVIQSIINSLEQAAENKKIDLKFRKTREKLPKINLDREKMGLAIQNLVENAINYTPQGGKVTVSLKCGKKEVEIAVSDTGMGIPSNQQKRVFTKFFRGSNAIKTETKGSGLGLYITKNIIEAHGGKIWFKSEERKGTKFYFTLPI